MFTDGVAEPVSLLQRRGAGKAGWKRVIENLIQSEKEDLQDLRTLRRLLTNNPEGLRILAEMAERKTIRVIELNDLLHYKDDDRNGKQ